MNVSKRIASAMLTALALSVSACSTMQDVVKVKQSGAEGTTKQYAVSEAQAWEIAKTVFRWEGADAIEEHRDQHYMLTSSGVNLVSWGAVMGAWVEPLENDDTKVTVVTKRRVTVNVATTLTETTFHKRFAQAVNIIKQGKPLPAEAP
ncbi:hypothetical protein [Methylophilus medardicus]|uniref:Uncharacterized protein n=1 Tax=Methylophilus medardicus TaxID=2588534 RepID=A0A5B8CTS0_9PROT|nr:hypothetical protein [Methylophilus medardicus]QDC44643.1 hypothetical protein FIU01_08930 [Methylophilus medardicus]QDC49650.1 hypothetical protein FIU00_08930 [Methylophilus medardicus]QDC53355.1 hypothetical protein FIT99_08930 [Methylophilus medardicus]